MGVSLGYPSGRALAAGSQVSQDTAYPEFLEVSDLKGYVYRGSRDPKKGHGGQKRNTCVCVGWTLAPGPGHSLLSPEV